VFDGASPSISNIISTTFEDLQQWSMAAAREVSYILALAPRDSWSSPGPVFVWKES